MVNKVGAPKKEDETTVTKKSLPSKHETNKLKEATDSKAVKPETAKPPEVRSNPSTSATKPNKPSPSKPKATKVDAAESPTTAEAQTTAQSASAKSIKKTPKRPNDENQMEAAQLESKNNVAQKRSCTCKGISVAISVFLVLALLASLLYWSLFVTANSEQHSGSDAAEEPEFPDDEYSYDDGNEPAGTEPSVTPPTANPNVAPDTNTSSTRRRPVNRTTRAPVLPVTPDPFTSPHATYFFPRIIDENVNFYEARKLCTPLENYTYDLSGLDQANSMFLEATADIIANIPWSRGVWVGGYFDLKKPFPYLVRWLDGLITDSRKSPNNIWCPNKFPETYIPPLVKSGLSIIPIVRLRNESNCLTPYVGDASKTLFFPMCVTNPVQIFLKLEDQIIIPPFYEQLFDKKNLGFVGLVQKYANLTGEARSNSNLSILTRGRSAALVGFKQLVTYNYAEALCRHVHYDVGTPRGSLLTDVVLNAANGQSQFYSTEIAKQRHWLSPLPSNSCLTTAGRNDVRSPRHVEVHNITFSDESKNWTSTPDSRGFPFCVDVSHITLPYIYAKLIVGDERAWNTGLKETNYRNYIYYPVIAARNTSSCLELAGDDLFWPGTPYWAPLCQATIK